MAGTLGHPTRGAWPLIYFPGFQIVSRWFRSHGSHKGKPSVTSCSGWPDSAAIWPEREIRRRATPFSSASFSSGSTTAPQGVTSLNEPMLIASTSFSGSSRKNSRFGLIRDSAIYISGSGGPNLTGGASVSARWTKKYIVWCSSSWLHQ